MAMIGVKSILDIWWELSGIFAGGMLGLFLLSIISRKAGNREAISGTVLGVLVILWMTFSYLVPEQYSYLKNPLHANMIRSEEHTSELQSLMRISYAVFRLKKKNHVYDAHYCHSTRHRLSKVQHPQLITL